MKLLQLLILSSVLHLLVVLSTGNAVWAFQTGNPHSVSNAVDTIVPITAESFMIPGEENIIPAGNGDNIYPKKNKIAGNQQGLTFVRHYTELSYFEIASATSAECSIFIKVCSFRI